MPVSPQILGNAETAGTIKKMLLLFLGQQHRKRLYYFLEIEVQSTAQHMISYIGNFNLRFQDK